MTSPVDIFNMALDQIKARASVTSINPSDGSVAGNVGARIYQQRIDALSRSAHWNCTRMQQSLGLLRAAVGTPENVSGALPVPPTPWLYEYALPTNPQCLKARYIVPVLAGSSSSTVPLMTGGGMVLPAYMGGNTTIPFLVSSDLDASGNQIRVILTNMSQAQLVYTARISDPDLWDAAFTDAAVMTLAEWACLPVGGDKQLGAACAVRANQYILEALVSDGDEGTTQYNHVPDWIAVRGATGGRPVVGSSNYDSMSFSDGSVF